MVRRSKPAALRARTSSSRKRSASEYSRYPASVTPDGGRTPPSE